MLLTIFTFLIVLSILVLVHEFGHFWVARRFGLKPEEFGWGFPPRAWGIYKSKEGKWKTVRGSKAVDDAADTIYSVNWLPIGGFVKLGEDDDAAGDPNHFNSQSIWHRAVILIAGVTMNIILAAVLLSFGYMIGLPRVTDDIGRGGVLIDHKIQISEVFPDSPAFQSGLKVGDAVVSIDGTVIDTVTKLQSIVGKNAGKNLEFAIKRGQEDLSKIIMPELRPDTKTGGIGVGLAETGLVRYPWYLAVWEGIKTTIFLIGAIVFAFYSMIRDIFMGHGVSSDVAGPIGIASLTGQVARMGFVYVLQFAALLSINLAIINALPFPALDGGRILFLLIEKIKGRPVKKELEGSIHYIGFMLLMLLVFLVTIKDISRYAGFFKGIWNRFF